MSAFIQARPSFSAGLDYHGAFLDMNSPSRKYSTNIDDFSCPGNYPVFNDNSQTKEEFRSLSQQQQHQQNEPSNHFTFNQSITHVNLVNNRFQIDIPNHHQYANDYQIPESMNGHLPSPAVPTTSINPYYKSDMMNRENSNIYSHSSMENYSSPPALINNNNPSEHLMNLYPSYPLKPTNEFQGMHGFNKFPLHDHSIISQNIQSYRMKSDNDYPPNFFTDHSASLLAANVNGGLPSSIMSPNIDKLTNMYNNSNTAKSHEHDVEQADETQKCKNTIEGTKTSVRRFKRWYKEKYNKEIDMNSVNRFNAPELLKDFFLDIRDTRPGRVGNEYEPVTLTTYRNGLRRYFLYRKVPSAPDNFDLTDKTFDIVNRHLVTKRDDLKRKGKGNHPNAVESITPVQLEKMWASGAIGTHAPRPLLRLQWWYNTVYHGVRGRMAHHDLTTDDFKMVRGIDGKIMMEYTKNLSNNQTHPLSPKMEPKKKKFKGLAKETDGGERDPIRAFELFKAHRPAGISSFYLTPKQKPKGNIWFNKVPMGKNSIGRIMREIKAISGI